MSRYQDPPDDDNPRPRGAGLPTWLVVTLSILLLFGLLCAGLIVLAIKSGGTMIDDGATQYTHQVLIEMATAVESYHQKEKSYPLSLSDLKAQLDNQYLEFHDYRDGWQGGATLVYLPPMSNGQPNDIVGHTRRDGPMPILAVRLNGSTVDFATARDLDQALLPQQTRALPEEEIFVPPTPQNKPQPPPRDPADTGDAPPTAPQPGAP